MADDLDTPDPRLLALLGDAARILVKANAASEVIGQFMQEYPACIRAQLKVQQAQAPQELDVEALIRATMAATVRAGLAGNPISDSSTPDDGQRTGSSRGPRGADRIKKNVMVQGKRTTIRLRTELYDQMVKLSAQTAEQQLQAFVDATPADHKNRTAWVEQQIREFVVLAEVRTSDQARH